MSSIEDLIKVIKNNNRQRLGTDQVTMAPLRRQKTAVDLDMIRLAYDFAEKAHDKQKRVSGEPYISHCVATAITLAEMNLDQESIVAGLLHDVPEDTNYTLVDIEKEFGSEVALLVGGISKLGVIKYRGIERYAENLRRMFISMAQDIRIIIIKMADRIHNLETLASLRPDKQLRIAKESLEIYAPIADRLGIALLKGIIEDLSFPYVYPKEYTWFSKDIQPKIEAEKAHIDLVIKIITKELQKEKVKFLSVHGREKRLYSLYTKLQWPEYNKQLDNIHDLVALRVILPTIADCYNVLGIIHNRYTPIIGRIKDYIAQPKPNGYRSLHTTVLSDAGKRVEFQIRTPQMHDEAEFGIAAHWKYKESKEKSKNLHAKGYTLPKKYTWVNDLVQWQKKVNNTHQYLKSLKVDFFQNRIFVLTPKGDVIDLPQYATPVDFAYHVHTWIGDHTTGAKINNQIATLNTELKNGDVIEIITDKNRKGPSRDWLGFVKTQTTKSKIRGKISRH